MAFWSDAQIEPKRKFKFILSLVGNESGVTIPSFVVKKVTKPSFTISESSHQFLGNKFYYPGKLEWKEVDVTIVDGGGFNEALDDAGTGTTIDGSLPFTGQQDMSARVYGILQKFGYQDPGAVGAALAEGGFNAGELRTFSKFAATTITPSITIDQLDSNGQIIERWTLKNAWIKDVNFGELDYTSEDLVEIQLKLRYDWAVFESGTGSTLLPTETP